MVRCWAQTGGDSRGERQIVQKRGSEQGNQLRDFGQKTTPTLVREGLRQASSRIASGQKKSDVEIFF